MDRSKELKDRADRYRRMLRTVDDAKTRSILLELAEQNEAAAEAAERAEGSEPRPGETDTKPDT